MHQRVGRPVLALDSGLKGMPGKGRAHGTERTGRTPRPPASACPLRRGKGRAESHRARHSARRTWLDDISVSIRRRSARTLSIAVISGNLLDSFGGGAQIGPVDIRAKVFAADGARGGFFNGRAVLGGNAAANPVADHLRRNFQGKRERNLSAYRQTIILERTGHGRRLNDAFSFVKRSVYPRRLKPW